MSRGVSITWLGHGTFYIQTGAGTKILVDGWVMTNPACPEELKGLSDIDLLLVLPDSDLPRHKRESLSYDLLWGLTTPVDVIVLTRAEFQRGCQVKSSLPSRVRAEGKLLYG